MLFSQRVETVIAIRWLELYHTVFAGAPACWSAHQNYLHDQRRRDLELYRLPGERLAVLHRHRQILMDP